MNWTTAYKIYMSRTHLFKNKRPYTRGDLVLFAFVGILCVPSIIILIPRVIYRIKKRGIKKENRKYYLYYKK